QIAALQADPGLQIAAQESLLTALAAWKAAPGVAAVLANFDQFSSGAALPDLPDLAALFGGGRAEAARAFVAPLLAGWANCLAKEPFGVVPMRHHAGATMATLMLAHAGDCMLNLVAVDGLKLAAVPAARTASFAPSEVWEVVLAGSGSGRLVERKAEAIIAHSLDLAPGLALGREADREALLIDRVDGALLMLRLQRRHDAIQPRREYALEDGRLLRQANATPVESRHEVAVAVLGRMGRSDAAPLLAEIARDENHGNSLRWQALRECLALDTRTGFWTLTAIARAGSDSLAVPAGALRAQLLETYPQLAEVELCHA
ncbi:MAG: hypothetical protein ABIU18_00335, partial [Novosphingobium sp.]